VTRDKGNIRVVAKVTKGSKRSAKRHFKEVHVEISRVIAKNFHLCEDFGRFSPDFGCSQGQMSYKLDISGEIRAIFFAQAQIFSNNSGKVCKPGVIGAWCHWARVSLGTRVIGDV